MAVFTLFVCISVSLTTIAKSDINVDDQLLEGNNAQGENCQQKVANTVFISGDLLTSFQGIVCSELERQLFRDQALISGPVHHVPDGALTSSGTYKGLEHYGPRCSRLGVPKPQGCGTTGWAPAVNPTQLWIQVDLGTSLMIAGVATQGRDEPHIVNYITSYKLAFYEDDAFAFYHDRRSSKPKVFSGNSDTTTIERRHLVPPIQAQIVRLYVVTSRGHAVFRWELYGYESIC